MCHCTHCSCSFRVVAFPPLCLRFFSLVFLLPLQHPQAALLKDRGAPSAPVAPAAVLGQTGLWGRLMGGPDTAKVHSEETESTDGEDEVGGKNENKTENKKRKSNVL